MPNRLTQLLMLAIALCATGASVVAFSDLGSTAPASAATTAEAPVLLPTVVVRPQAEIPVLGEITVSPSHAERVAAGLDATDEDNDALDLVTERMRASSRALLPSGGLDMPYYSFGKTLHRVNKE